jgi:hypothetical protein
MEELEIVKRLTNDELVLRVRHCVREDRRVSAQLLAHLGEIEARGLHRDLGYESMFAYAVRVLHMSDSEAGLRLHAARFARKFPASLEMLSRGELHLTAMKLLAPVLTSENAELLDMSCLKTKQEIQLLIAKHCPQPDVPDAVVGCRPRVRTRARLRHAALPVSDYLPTAKVRRRIFPDGIRTTGTLHWNQLPQQKQTAGVYRWRLVLPQSPTESWHRRGVVQPNQVSPRPRRTLRAWPTRPG